MFPSAYSDFTTLGDALDDTIASNTWLRWLGQLYWLVALFAWIIVYNLDLIEDSLRRPFLSVQPILECDNLDLIEESLRRPRLSTQPISDYTKGQRRIRRLHEASILLLAFGALSFLSSLPPSGQHPCSRVEGKRFWRCVRSTNFAEGAIAQQTRPIVVGKDKNTNDLSSASSPRMSNPKHMHPYAASSQSSHGARFNDSDKSADSIIQYLLLPDKERQKHPNFLNSIKRGYG
jgi:hypothetical protein